MVVFPGTGYGDQAYVTDRLQRQVLGQVGSPPVLIAVAPAHDTAWLEVTHALQNYSSSQGKELVPGALVGWSGGVAGIQKAQKAEHTYPSVLLADPSPNRSAFAPSNTRIWYRPENWKGKYAHLGPTQRRYAEAAGGRAHYVELGHNEILDMVLEKAITEQSKGIRRTPWWAWLVMGLAVFAVGTAVAKRRRALDSRSSSRYLR